MNSGMKEIFDRLRKENVRLNKRIEDLEGQLSGYKRAYAKDDKRITELEGALEYQRDRFRNWPYWSDDAENNIPEMIEEINEALSEGGSDD